MSRAIDGETLYERACDLEAQALAYVGKIANDETKIEEWKIWSAILVERTAFKQDIFDAPEVKPEPHWIPCSERLPFAEYGEGDNVLATCGHRDGEDTSIRWIRILYFNGWCWCYPTGETYDQKVYAWMPLPEVYREGE